MANLVPLEKAPAVLADRAQQIRTAFGHVDMVADSGDGFTIAPDYPRWLVETVKTADRWSPEHVSAGPAVLYWYRTSPRSLSPLRPSILITPTDPPFTMTGMTLTLLDSEGRLQEFHAVPAQHDPPQGSTPSPPWPAVFDAAGLPMSSFAPAEPEWTPRDFADTRMAWTGARANRPDIPLRVEAAAYRGTIVSVYIIGPWSRASRMTPLTQSALNRALSTFSTMLWMSVLGGAVLFARHNMRANRADRRSAARLAATFLIAPVVAWTVGGHHLSGVADEAQGLVRIVGTGLIGAAIVWTLYLALEPYGRRFWPDGLLGWTRLFSGHVRDPRIGREILVGAALGAVLMMIDLFRAASPPLFGQPSAIPVLGASVDTLIGPGRLVIEWMQQFYNSVQTALIIVMLFVLMKLLVRHTLVAAILLTLIGGVAAGSNLPTGGPVWINAVAQVAAIALMTFAIVRFGLLVTAVLLLVDNIPTAVPFTTHGGAWAVTPGRLSMLLVLAIVGFGFYAARAGQPLFGKFEV
jgi:serine/threonine-protein kinase